MYSQDFLLFNLFIYFYYIINAFLFVKLKPNQEKETFAKLFLDFFLFETVNIDFD